MAIQFFDIFIGRMIGFDLFRLTISFMNWYGSLLMFEYDSQEKEFNYYFLFIHGSIKLNKAV